MPKTKDKKKNSAEYLDEIKNKGYPKKDKDDTGDDDLEVAENVPMA